MIPMRRLLLLAGVALSALFAAPLASAETVLKAVMESDVKVLDPISSDAYEMTQERSLGFASR